MDIFRIIYLQFFGPGDRDEDNTKSDSDSGQEQT